jgi:GNAT superfamily N-acetyltransferase
MAGRVTIRAAEPQDLDALLELAEVRRREYATYQPVFWRPAPDALAHQRPYLAGLLREQDVVARVAVIDTLVVGFAIGRLTPAPPVYDPGGPTCLIDDFAVADPDSWLTVGLDLVRAVSDAARERGAVQVVVVTAYADTAKRAALAAGGLDIASEWWTRPLTSCPDDSV